MDDYLQQGIHGAKVTKPDERRRFLGTIRERVAVALTQAQIGDDSLLPQLEQIMDEHASAHLYLNGNISYSAFSHYIEAAKKRGITYTMVTNKEHDSDLGLVLAHDQAIDKEEIFLEKKPEAPITGKKASEISLLSQLKNKLFKNDD